MLFWPERYLSQYTEVDDPDNRIVLTDLAVTWTGFIRTETAYAYRDFGANFFNGDFTFTMNVKSTAGSGSFPGVAIWSLGNSLGNLVSIGSNLHCILYTVAGYLGIQLYEQDGVTLNQSSLIALVNNTDYWIKIWRDESIGTYGTIYAAVYSDSGMTTQVGSTASIALHTSKKDFRYLYGLNSYYYVSGGASSGYVKNLIYWRSHDPFVLASSLSGGYITPTYINADPFLAALLFQAGLAISMTSPAFEVQGELSAGILVHYRLLQRLVNSIRWRSSDLRLVNSLAYDVTKSLSLMNDIVGSVEKTLTLKNTLEELAQISKTLSLRNGLEGGYAVDEYYFDEAHDV